MTRLSDSEAARLRGGDSEVFRTLIREHTGSLLRWVRSFADGPDEADDLVQEVWQRVLARRATYRGTGSFRGWLHKVARTVCVDHARGRASRRTAQQRVEAHVRAAVEADARAQADAATSTTPDDRLEEESLRTRVRRAVEALPPRQREVVTLRILEGLSTRETADVMECAEGTVKAALSHALAKLREQFGEDGAGRQRPTSTTKSNMHDDRG